MLFPQYKMAMVRDRTIKCKVDTVGIVEQEVLGCDRQLGKVD